MNNGLSRFDEPDPRESIPGYVDLYELLNSPPYEETWIASHLVPKGRMVALVGPAKSGKSLLALHCAAAIASGRPFLGKPTIQSTVLYIDQENIPTRDVGPRLIKMGYEWEELEQHLIYSSYGDYSDFNTPKGANQLMNVIRKHEVQVVIIDTISRTVYGKENDNDTWNELHKHLERHLKNEGISLLRLDHTGKDTDKGPRGGSAKLGDVDMTLIITPIVDNSQRLFLENSRMEVSWKKAELNIIEAPVLNYTLREIHKEPKEDRIQRLVTLLDANNIEVNLTVEETRQELQALGEGAATDVVAAVTKQRKSKRAKQSRTTSPRQEWRLHAV